MTRRRISGLALVLMCFALVLAPTPSNAQAVYGSIIGTVTDTSGAAVPGAKVSVTSVKQANTVDTVSNETGNYTVDHLIPGDYDVKVEATNFKSAENTAVTVNADAASKLDVKLEVGAVSQTVDVTAQPDLLKTDKSDVAIVFNEKAVSELPLFNRNFTQLELSVPGTQRLVGWSHAATENPQAGQQIFVNGQHFSGTAFELDGTDNQDPILGIIVINPTLESVTEAKITTQNYDAQFGKAIAGVVASQTKSGSNSLHGSAFGFRRSDALQARNPYTQSRPDPVSGRLVPPSKWTQYGGSIGGPIKKDKTFFFGDYQGTRRTTGTTQQVTVPTALVRSTCLAAVGNCNLSEYLNGGQGQIFDPNTGNPDGTGRTPFVGNLIPVGRLSAPALALLKALPAPATAGISTNLTGAGAGPYDDDEFNVRVDHAATEKLHLFGRYSLADYRLSGKGIFGALGGPGFGQGGLAGSSKSRDQSIASGFDYALSSTLLTDFRFGYLRYHVNANKFDVGTAPATAFGIPGLNTGTVATSGLPGFFVDGISNFGEALNITRCNCGLIEEESQLQFVNNWTKTIGNHSVKFGGDIRFARNLRVPSDANRAGQLSFSGSDTSNGGAGGLGLATFLLGNVTHLERYVSSSTTASERQKRWFFYGQDLWRITPKLTVNYGTRYEIYFPESVNAKGNGGFADLNTGTIRVAGFGGIGLNGNIQNSFTNFAPRLGLSYQFDQKTVVRMGYGRSFDLGVFGSNFGHTVTQNLPVLVDQNLSGPTPDRTAVFTLTAGAPAFVFPAIPANGLIPFADGSNPKIRPTKIRLPTIDAWNLAIERQITSSMTAEIAYVGNKGTHVFAGDGPSFNVNQASIVGFGTIPFNQRRPFFNKFNNGGVICCSGDLNYLANSAGNNYNSLQAKLTRRLSQGLQFSAHYTWSRAMAYNDNYFAINPFTGYGPDDYNRRHVFVLDMLYELPIGRGRMFMSDMNRFADAILGGWQLSTITNISSGLPFTAGYSECGQDRDTGPCRPNRVGSFSQGVGGLVINGGSPYRTYFTPVAPLTVNGANSGAFSRPAVGAFGGSYNSFTGPRSFSSDMGLLKNFSITERFKARFTADAFNIFNHPIQAIPGNTCIDCTGPGGDAGRITNIEEGTKMRNFQFGLRLSF